MIKSAIFILVISVFILASCKSKPSDAQKVAEVKKDDSEISADTISSIAESVVVLNADTGKELFIKNPEKSMIPASLTKLVTSYVILDKERKGLLDMNEKFLVSEKFFSSSVASKSTKMNLTKEREVSMDQLLAGALAVSANDAAVAMALRVTPEISIFVDTMNALVKRLGFKDMVFHDPAGSSPENHINAREFARFSSAYIKNFPNALKEYNCKDSIAVEKKKGEVIYLKNNNGLINKYEGCDGLKTGYISQSGFNSVATAKRNGKRVLVVLLGIEATSIDEGNALREKEAIRLLDKAFEKIEK